MDLIINHFESIELDSNFVNVPFIRFQRSLYRLTFLSNLLNRTIKIPSLELRIVVTQVIKETQEIDKSNEANIAKRPNRLGRKIANSRTN